MTATSKHDTDLEAEPEESATEPATTEAATAEPTAARTAAESTRVEPIDAEPTDVEPPVPAEAPTAAEAPAAKPAAAGPAAARTAAAETAAESTRAEPADAEPAGAEPADAESAAAAKPAAEGAQGADSDSEELSEVSDSVETGGPPGGRKDHSSGGRRRPRLAVVALAVAVALVAAGGVFAWLQINELRDRAAAPEQARQAAMRFAADLGTYDYRDPAGNFRLVAEQSTDNFSGQLKQITEAMTPLLQQTKATSKGNVAAAGVSRADEHRAVVVLFLDQTIENTNTKQPRVDRSRMQLTLVNEDGVWKLDHVEAR